MAQQQPANLPRQIYGKVRVVDSTTFEFVRTTQLVRLAGFEAPRLEQTATDDGVSWPVGQVSRAWMILRTLGQNLNCAPIGRDRNKVLIAHCFVGETNLAATAIAEGIGYAFNYRDEPQVPAYFDIERKARGLGYGVWSSPDLPPPWLYAATIAKPADFEPERPDTKMELPCPCRSPKK
ncbi:thermonuclease family protein (plasmid) [Aliirhizobium terrae]|uniref:thermonuclease family protein n=1 Tax=Terrirhizobium terrae TaxID=2926709 RepID=UPI0025788B44|nr:thermonuclease family protein [Rhizobium sp. CC-CFT758]WJH38554.1 thermonuclease family protein [Rhizobium sp. CC-CFT758]